MPGTNSKNRVAIVGGGIGGISLAGALRAGGHLGEIVLIEEAEFPYDRPPLSKAFLAGERTLKELALQPPEWYADHDITLLAPARVVSFEPGEASVRVDIDGVDGGERLHASHLVLATGGQAALPPISGLAEATETGRVHTLREHRDAEALRTVLMPGARLLVVGAGLIGAEVASTALELGCSVVLADPADPPLAAAGVEVARWLHGQHRVHGAETMETSVESLRPTEIGVEAQLLGEDTPREFDAVLIGVGIVPRTQLAEAAGLDVDRGVLIDDLYRTSHPRVLAIGDVARTRGPDGQRSEHWDAAKRDGERAAATILDAPAPAAAAPWWWSDRHGHHVEGIGLMAPGARHVVRGQVGEPPFTTFAVEGARVVGAVAVGDPQAIRAARRLIERGIEVDPDRLADPTTDLRKLLRGTP